MLTLEGMASVSTAYISVGGNRHPSAADWDVQSGVLAYGADINVALWEPLVSPMRLINLPGAVETELTTLLG